MERQTLIWAAKSLPMPKLHVSDRPGGDGSDGINFDIGMSETKALTMSSTLEHCVSIILSLGDIAVEGILRSSSGFASLNEWNEYKENESKTLQ